MVDDEAKIGRYYRLSSDTIKKIGIYSKENNISNASVIEHAIKVLFESRTEEHKNLMESIDSLLELKLNEKLSGMIEDLNRIRITSNVIDRNVQMELEFWNHYFVVNKAKVLGSTDKFKTGPLTEAEDLIKNRIGQRRQKKIDWENKRNKPDE